MPHIEVNEHKHTREEHEKECEEIYEAITKIVDGKCRVSIEMALAHSIFDVIMAGYPDVYDKDKCILYLAEMQQKIINNMKTIFDKVEANLESDSSTKH